MESTKHLTSQTCKSNWREFNYFKIAS